MGTPATPTHGRTRYSGELVPARVALAQPESAHLVEEEVAELAGSRIAGCRRGHQSHTTAIPPGLSLTPRTPMARPLAVEFQPAQPTASGLNAAPTTPVPFPKKSWHSPLTPVSVSLVPTTPTDEALLP